MASAAPPEPPPAEQVLGFGEVWEYARGVVGSAHDFTDGLGNACNGCHIPHIQAIRPTTQPVAPLQIPTTQPPTSPAVVELFRIAGQRRVFVPGRYTPGPTSLICLGCHDGTIGCSTIGASHGMLASVRAGFDVPDGFVWRDHPIGIKYPVERRNYAPEVFVISRGIRLPEGCVECISCHDPHNLSGVPHLLSKSNRRSGLCLTCHIK